MKKLHGESLSDCDASCDKVVIYWQYFCNTVQIVACIGCMVLFGLIIFMQANIEMAISFGGNTAAAPGAPNPGHTINPYPKGFAGLDYNEITLLSTHKNGTAPTAEEEAVVRKVFDHYTDDDECIDYAEFTLFVTDSLQAEEQFALMDVNNDGEVDYGELVYLLTQLDEIPLLHTPDITDMLVEIFGDAYSDDAEPEFLAEILFEEMDTNKEDVITKDAYIAYEVEQEWNEYNENDDECISFDEFVAKFFESAFYSTFQELQREENEEEFDMEDIKNRIQTAQQEDIDDLDLMFEPHQFDEQIQSVRRRLIICGGVCILIIKAIITVIAKLGIYGIYSASVNAGGACLDDGGSVNVLGHSLQRMRDLKLGDFVYDGNGYSQIFYIFRPQTSKVKMNKIRFGNPSLDNSLTLTPDHLLYRNGDELPISSDRIEIGDILCGMDQTDYIYEMYYGVDDNYTVYDVSPVYAVPIAPITHSGKLMVNGVETSAYSLSIGDHDTCHKASAMFRWISNNIDQQLASNMIDFVYTTFQPQFEDKQIESVALFSVISTALCVIGVPVLSVYFAKKVLRKAFKNASKTKSE